MHDLIVTMLDLRVRVSNPGLSFLYQIEALYFMSFIVPNARTNPTETCCLHIKALCLLAVHVPA